MARDRVAVFVVFGLNGAVYGTWAPRVPALAERLHAAPGSLGLALLGSSIGMLVAASMSGRLVERFGARAAIVASTLLSCAVLPFIGAAGSVPTLGFVMFGLGVSVGALDVSMNIGAVGVERRVGHAIMPLFHAGFSFGGLIASGAAGLAAAQHWSPLRHFLVAAAVVLVTLLLVLPGLPRAAARAERAPPAVRVAPIRRPVLWLLAAIALCSAIAEGASSDWSALLLVTVQHIDQAAAALAFAGFSLTMAVTRLGGAWVQNRFGPTRTLAAGAALAGFGLVVAAVVPVAGLAFAGFGLAGAGLAASFPIALSLAGAAGKRDDDSGGEREIAFVTTIAYSGFLAGPPVIGGIAQLSSLSVSFVVVGLLAALIAPAAVGAGRARHRELTAGTTAA
ncbi:MFS transporter [Amycolatopsis acidiphila]|uniref:MFS transporter n=1 Tax=Amycolatopsis acidiphila TaxID=715473 RepID=A0A558AD14_9PSEU|nr:MFS transporter [Amycolatopsis acidiphila]TVT22164.1 MFS transporter [Amycolatopsis acidiphila]UIJ61639.1 MFS transporter [Amycolatopsis acidiphila]GHG58731.1 MFS transporter [Amycolatopsis acidiphila]